jgi:hypothetical protein
MSGRSGSSVASHTPLVRINGVGFRLSPAEMTLVRRAKTNLARAVIVEGLEARRAEKLCAIGLGELRDDVPEDGKTTFVLAEGVEIMQLGRLP